MKIMTLSNFAIVVLATLTLVIGGCGQKNYKTILKFQSDNDTDLTVEMLFSKSDTTYRIFLQGIEEYRTDNIQDAEGVLKTLYESGECCFVPFLPIHPEHIQAFGEYSYEELDDTMGKFRRYTIRREGSELEPKSHVLSYEYLGGAYTVSFGGIASLFAARQFAQELTSHLESLDSTSQFQTKNLLVEAVGFDSLSAAEIERIQTVLTESDSSGYLRMAFYREGFANNRLEATVYRATYTVDPDSLESFTSAQLYSLDEFLYFLRENL